MKSICCFLLCLFVISISYTQSKLANKDYYKAYDSLVRNENNTIFNGLAHVDEFPSLTSDNHKFFNLPNFLKGDIVYNGQPYFDIKMKYDLLNDLILIEYINEKSNYLSLNSTMISEFLLNKSKFVRLKENEILKSFYKNGIFKVDYQDKHYSFYSKHIKNKVKKFNNGKVYYVFTDEEVYVLKYRDLYYKINSKKDIIDAISDKEAYIKNFYDSNKRLYNKSRYIFIMKLLKALGNANLSKAN